MRPPMLRPCLFAAALAALLSGCGSASSTAGGPAETLAPRAWTETLEADGEIRAAANTPLTVPGSGWSGRVLVEMIPDGSSVTKGQVVARFDAPQARADLSQADVELLRKTLAEEANRRNAAVETCIGDTGRVLRIDDGDAEPAFRQGERQRQAGKAAADDQHIALVIGFFHGPQTPPESPESPARAAICPRLRGGLGCRQKRKGRHTPMSETMSETLAPAAKDDDLEAAE